MITNFTVGPAKLYHGVKDFLCKSILADLGELGHRSPNFTQYSKQTIKDFKDFFRVPNNYRVFYTYSATEGLELATKNCVTSNITHISNGNFGTLWTKLSEKTGKNVQTFSLDSEKLQHGQRINLNKIIPQINTQTEMICITANETASGVAYTENEITDFSKKLKQKFNNQTEKTPLIAVDITSGIGGYAYDFTSADVWAFSVQKALGLPAGLGILVISEQAYQKSIQREEQRQDTGAHHSFSSLDKKMNEKFQTPTTPNFLGIISLGYIAKQFKKDFKNIQNLAKITQEKADLFYQKIESSKILSTQITPLVKDKKARSKTILVLNGNEENITNIFNKLENKNIQIGKGYGQYKKHNLRIGNFPVHTQEDLDNVLKNM